MTLHKTVILILLFPGLLLAQSPVPDERATVRLSPQMRELPRDGATSRLPRAELNNFLLPHRLIEPMQYEQAPYIVASASESLVLGSGEQVHVRGLPDDARGLWGIYRSGQHYVDPLTGESLGQEILRLGTAEVLQREADQLWRLQIRDSQQEVQPGDRLLRRDGAALSLYFDLQPAPAGLQGQISGLPGGQRFAAQYDSVLLNRGAQHGLLEGHVMAVYAEPGQRNDPISGSVSTLPGNAAASLMVYRVFEHVSYAIILSSTLPSQLGDRVVSSTPGER